MTGGVGGEPSLGSNPKPMYYGGRGADAYLKRRRGGGVLKIIGLVLAVLVVLGGTFAGGYLLGKNSADDDVAAGTSGASTTTTLDATGAPTVPPTTVGVPVDTTRPETYIVQAGDTLGKLAKRFGTTIAAIVELNNIANPDRLIEGTRLKIPPPTTPPAPAATAPPSS